MSIPLEMYLDPVKKTFMFDTSTMSVACDRKLHWGRFRNLKRAIHGEATYFGTCLHKFVEHFWLGDSFDDCISAYYKLARADDSPLIDDSDEEDNLRTVQRGFEVCTLYFKKYTSHETINRSRIKVYVLNGKPLVEIPFAFPLGTDSDGWTYLFCGKMDRVELRDASELWIVDTKSTTRFGKKYWQCLRPNDQITGYAAGLRELVGKLPTYYAIDVIAMGKPREKAPKDIQALGPDAIAEYKVNIRFEQGPTGRSEVDVNDWWENAFNEGIRMRKLWTDYKDNHLLWTRRTSQCGAYGGCDFLDLCKVPVGFEPIIDSLYVVQPWSPFDHAEENGEEA